MKLKDGFVLRQIADTWIVLAVGQASIDFNGVLTLNESGMLLWRALEQNADREKMTEILIAEYAVSREIASHDVDEFIAKLEKAGCVVM